MVEMDGGLSEMQEVGNRRKSSVAFLISIRNPSLHRPILFVWRSFGVDGRIVCSGFNFRLDQR